MDWIERPICIKNKDSYHMRSAQQIVAASNEFDADIRLVIKNEEFNPKDILEMLNFGFVLMYNERVAVKAKGTQALQAINALEFMFEKILKKS